MNGLHSVQFCCSLPVVLHTGIIYLIFYSRSEHLYNVINSAAVLCDLAKKGESMFKKKKIFKERKNRKKASRSPYLFLEKQNF